MQSLSFALMVLAATVPQMVGPQMALAGDWSLFRGGDAAGYVPEAQLPLQWTANDYAWQFDLENRDVGSPVIAGGKAFLLSSDPQSSQRRIIAVDLKSGEPLWQRKYTSTPHRLHQRNSYASSTPAATDRFVFFAYSEPDHTYLKCLDHEGREVWSRDFGRWVSQHGFGTSPTLIGDLLILFVSQQADQLREGVEPGQSRMIAVRPETGETVWETPLTTTRACYGVPRLYQNDQGEKQIVAANTGDGLFGLDYATGKKLWNNKVFRARCVSSPLVVDDLVIGTAGSGGGGNHLVAVRPAGDEAEEVFRIESAAPYVPTPAVVGHHLYMVDDKGIASCVDARDGSVLWRKRVGGNYGASPVVLGNKVLLISLSGEATVLEAATEFNQLSQFDLGGPVGATPVYGDGKLLLRIGEQLCCLSGI